MNINRNMLKIVAGVLLAASLPAGAQVLGGNVGGAMNGALGGGMGQGIHGAGGVMGAGSISGADVAGAAGKVRERAKQSGERARDAAAGTAGATSSRVEETRNAAAATTQGAASAGAAAGHNAATTTQSGTAAANGAASPPPAQPGGVLFDGSTSTDVEKHALGRDVSATGGASSTGSLDRAGFSHSSSGQADASVKKTERAPAQTTPAQ